MHSPVSSVHVPESTLKHVHSTCSTCSARAHSSHCSELLGHGRFYAKQLCLINKHLADSLHSAAGLSVHVK